MSLEMDLARPLAEQAIAMSKKMNDPTVITKVAKTLSDSSQTMEDAFMTVVRLELATERGQETLDQIIKGNKVDILDDPNL